MHSVLWLVLTLSAVRAQVGDGPAPALPVGEGAVAPAPLDPGTPLPAAPQHGVPTPAYAPVYDAPAVISTPRGTGCSCCDKTPTCEVTCAAPVTCVSKPTCCSPPTCAAPTCGCEPTCGCDAPTCKTRCLKCVCKPKVHCKPCRSHCCVCKPKCHKPCAQNCCVSGGCGGGHCNSGQCGGGNCAPCGHNGCDTCGDGYGGGHGGGGYGGGERLSMAAKIQQARIAHPPLGDVFTQMPQTCYNPPYGCYAGSRFTNRYPAFHGTYYRNSYHYRNYFDYPWHAEMHEPTSRFSYNTEPNSRNGAPLPAHVNNQYQDPRYQARPIAAQQPVDPRLIRR